MVDRRGRRPRTKHELRCFCAREPLLALYGVDERGRLYLHQRVYKAGRVFGESFHYGGIVQLLCRECYRWNEVVIQDPTQVALKPIATPKMARDEVADRESLPPADPPR